METMTSAEATPTDLDSLARATGRAFDAVLRALLGRDKHTAREVLRDSAARRLLAASAKESLRTSAVPAQAVADQLKLVTDIGRIGQIIDHLARRVLDDGDPVSLSPTARLEVAVLLDAGGCRLRELTEWSRTHGLGADPAHRRSGSALFEVADRACHDPSVSMRLCAGLAVTLLQASRHAARAA
jgi:hypothetical protein